MALVAFTFEESKNDYFISISVNILRFYIIIYLIINKISCIFLLLFSFWGNIFFGNSLSNFKDFENSFLTTIEFVNFLN